MRAMMPESTIAIRFRDCSAMDRAYPRVLKHRLSALILHFNSRTHATAPRRERVNFHAAALRENLLALRAAR
jgi:hypothetical protein